ncbi:MAG: hypothetical protein LBC12_00540 [Nitrososphaerota archaeon]|jgi:predicted transcriptional regulator|nr:hypothetical protein [Nitrososphaerota archaeon]
MSFNNNNEGLGNHNSSRGGNAVYLLDVAKILTACNNSKPVKASTIRYKCHLKNEPHLYQYLQELTNTEMLNKTQTSPITKYQTSTTGFNRLNSIKQALYPTTITIKTKKEKKTTTTEEGT